MSITTKNGDNGDTRLCCNCIVSKSHERIKCNGDVDILVSLLGVSKSLICGLNCMLTHELETIQRDLFLVGSEVACEKDKLGILKHRINESVLKSLDERRTFLEAQITMPKGFIVPGNNQLSASLDVCRAYCRTLERSIVELTEKSMLDNQFMIPFINRLSDYLYLLARNAENNSYNHV